MGVQFKLIDRIAFIEFDLPDSKVNILTASVIQELDRILDQLKGNGQIDALVVTSNKPDVFIAGADIKEIEGITVPADGEAKSRAGQAVLDKLEDLPVPTIAVIDGVALGGGCELVLACRYRIATFNEKVKIGLPEVNLGFVPGFGGTYRLPRLLGLQQALNLILTGKPVDGRKALKIGLVDRLYPQKGLDKSLMNFINEVKGLHRRPASFAPRKKGMERFLDTTITGRMIVFSQARKNVLKQSKGFYPAPLKAIEVVRRTLGMSRSRALAIEAQEFSKLAVTDISKNLVKIFYLSERYKKLMPEFCRNVSAPEIKKCAVVGAGVMGGGIAQILSYNDINVRMKDINWNAVAQGFRSASDVYRQVVKRRRLTLSLAQGKMLKISGTVDYSGFANTDAVIEAVVENLDIKKKVFKEICAAVSDETILCTNTSALSVTAMAESCSHPERLIGFHFFNPVHRMPLVEIITTKYCSPRTIAVALGLCRRIGKTPILVKDAPGFLVNRILLSYINEAGRLLEEGYEMLAIDKIMTDFGLPMGPFILSDEVGLDVGYKVLHILEEGLGERFKPASIFAKVCENGLLGKKNGKGFYLHGKKLTEPNSQIHKLLGITSAKSLDEKTLRDRMLLIMINEAASCLQDGVVDDPGAVDVGMIMGTGFPPFRGGLLRYADSLGLETVVETLKLYEGRTGSVRFKPCPYLEELAKHKKGFYGQTA